MSIKNKIKLHAVVVTFNPEIDTLMSQFELLSHQVEKIWVIDNASTQSLVSLVSSVGIECSLQLVQMSTNIGIGAAQNVGIKLACVEGAKYVLILDQDSLPMPEMAHYLMVASESFRAAGIPVAAVAPVCVDRVTGARSGFVRLGMFDYEKLFVSAEDAPVEVDFVISSGSLIPVDTFDKIGLIDEGLFIDHVDTEWCLRARSKGFKLFGIPEAVMLHSLGNTRKRVWFLRWRNVPYHSPFRYYYMLRNGVLLRKRPYTPLKWRIGEFMRSLQMLDRKSVV